MAEEAFMIRPTHDRLLRGNDEMPIGLYHLHLATAEQLCHLHYSPNSVKRVATLLRELTKNGYVQFDVAPTRFYRSPYYYAFAEEGIAYLRELGLPIGDSTRASKEVGRSYLFLQHTLDVNDIIVSAALLRKVAQESTTCTLVDFTHERELKRKPFKGKLDEKEFSVIPDALFSFELSLAAEAEQYVVFLEHDRGTEGQASFRAKIRSYNLFFKSEIFKRTYGACRSVVAFTTFADVKRLKVIREWTHRELTATKEPQTICQMFKFASLAKPLDSRAVWLEPHWYTHAIENDLKPVCLFAH